MEKNKQINRIETMENHLDRLTAAAKSLEGALEEYAAAQESFTALNEYLGSEQWNKDFNDSNEGRLPADLKCGVLSEDGIWDVLTDCQRLEEEMRHWGEHRE